MIHTSKLRHKGTTILGHPAMLSVAVFETIDHAQEVRVARSLQAAQYLVGWTVAGGRLAMSSMLRNPRFVELCEQSDLAVVHGYGEARTTKPFALRDLQWKVQPSRLEIKPQQNPEPITIAWDHSQRLYPYSAVLTVIGETVAGVSAVVAELGEEQLAQSVEQLYTYTK